LKCLPCLADFRNALIPDFFWCMTVVAVLAYEIYLFRETQMLQVIYNEYKRIASGLQLKKGAAALKFLVQVDIYRRLLLQNYTTVVNQRDDRIL
jgi:hypothetical protein